METIKANIKTDVEQLLNYDLLCQGISKNICEAVDDVNKAKITLFDIFVMKQ